MKFCKLFENVEGTVFKHGSDTDIENITIDSRKAGKGWLFVCIQGFTTDGHKFIPKAYEQGCRAFLCEKEPENIPDDADVFVAPNSRIALAKAAAVFYGDPSKKFNLIGVTGTNGKTSSTYFMESILKTVGRKTAVIGTVEIRIGDEKLDVHLATSTTPDTVELNSLFDLMSKKGVDDVIMEVSSHGLELHKVDFADFDHCIFTNLTQDHLDLHKTMENYCNAKARLFKMCKKAVVNTDDEWSGKIIDAAECPVTTFGIDSDCQLKAKNIEYLSDRVKFTVNINGEDVPFDLPVPGRFSVYNALGVIATALDMGIGVKDIQKGISNIKGVPGRIQSIPNNKGINVIVDYAHTPDGLDKILRAVREFSKKRIITVFGCGGDRDRTKRPVMGEIAAKLSDYCILTSDNPRSEEPEDILKEIEIGVKPVTDKYEMLADRREGIFRAVMLAEEGDTVVIAGKGHEDYEIFKDRTIHFDDTEVAKEALEEKK